MAKHPNPFQKEQPPGDNEIDLGFGTKLTSKKRLIDQNGRLNVLRKGADSWHPYQSLVEMSWGRFFMIVALFYFGVNAFFALLFMVNGVENIAGVEPAGWLEDFMQAFFFSAQTFTTVGYGHMSPVGWGASMIASIVALVGLMAFALATGLFFARFSKPQSQILYSEHAIIAPYHGGKSFQFRIANRRNNKISDLEAQIVATWVEEVDGEIKRQFRLMPLERTKVFLLPLNWTIVHPINEQSPLFRKDNKDCSIMNFEVLIQLKGHDETYAQTVHSNHSYTFKELLWNKKFKQMYHSDENGDTVLDLDELGDVEEVG